jgi:DNA (cytosine-5)-methyltransferase 1
MIGYGHKARDAHLALIEIAASICRPEYRWCHLCPLSEECVGKVELTVDATHDEERQRLF